jgi:hypothetical protein
LAIEKYIRIFRYMKEIFKFVGNLILLYLVYQAFKWVWNSGIVGKIAIIIFFILGLMNSFRPGGSQSPLLKNHKVSYPNYVHLVE